MTELQTYIFYYLIIIISSLFAAISIKIKGKNIGKLFFILALLIPATVSAIRFGVGTDYFNYLNIYYNLTETRDLSYHLENSRLEPGWILLNYLVKQIFDDGIYIFIISSFMIWLFSFIAIYQNRRHINVGVAVFVLLIISLNPSFNLIRLYIAASIILLSVKYIIDKKFWQFLLIVLLAGTFHYSSLIFLLVYWVVNSKHRIIGSFKKGLALIGTILAVLFAEIVLNLITEIEVFSTYSRYEIQYSGLGLGVILLDIPIIAIILLNLFNLRKSKNPISDITIIYFIGIVLSFLGYLVNYGGRIATYFELMQFLIIAAIIKVQHNKYKKIIYFILVVGYYFSLYTYNYVLNNAHETVPYIWLP